MHTQPLSDRAAVSAAAAACPAPTSERGGRQWRGLLLAALLVAAAGRPAPAQVNLLQNGSFEKPRVHPEIDSLTVGAAAMPGWRVLDGFAAIVPYSIWQGAADQGTQCLLLGGAQGPGSVEQSVATRPGQYYMVSGWLAHDPRVTGGQAQVYLNGQPFAQLAHSEAKVSSEAMGWVLFAHRFQAKGDTTTLKISGMGVALDGMAVTFAGGPTTRPPFFTVDLSQHLTHRLFDPMLSPGNTLIDLGDSLRPEQPLRVFRGVPFLTDGAILVGPGEVGDVKVAEQVAGIPVGRRARHLYFLHATNYSQSPPSTVIGSYVLYYADGSRVTIPLRYGIDLADWWTYPGTEARAPVAWQGRNPATTAWDRETDFLSIVGRPLGVQLYLMTWPNPQPEVPIQSLDVVSTQAPDDPVAAPFLVAVTGD